MRVRRVQTVTPDFSPIFSGSQRTVAHHPVPGKTVLAGFPTYPDFLLFDYIQQLKQK